MLTGVAGSARILLYGEFRLDFFADRRISLDRRVSLGNAPAKGCLCKLHKNVYLYGRLHIHSFLCNLHKNEYSFIWLYIHSFLCRLYKGGLRPLRLRFLTISTIQLPFYDSHNILEIGALLSNQCTVQHRKQSG